MSSNRTRSRGTWVFLAVAGTLGLILAGERLLFAFFRGPAWVVVPLAAALVGWLAARAAGRWSGVLVLGLLVGAPLVALIGEWSRYAAEVRRALVPTVAQSLASERARATQAAQAFLERRERGITTAPTEPPDEKSVSDPPAAAASRIRQMGPIALIRLYFESLPNRLGPLLLGVALALPVAFQAARMTLARLRV